jgi:hypothetical protein
MFRRKAGACQSASLKAVHLALPSNVRPDWKRLQGTNTPAYIASCDEEKKFYNNEAMCIQNLKKSVHALKYFSLIDK